MASEQLSPRDTMAGTVATNSGLVSPETLVYTTVIIDLEDNAPRVEKPVVKLPPRPSTAPPTSPVTPATPAFLAPVVTPSESPLKDTAPGSAAPASAESNLDAKAEEDGVKKRRNEIFIHEDAAVTGSPPVYPVSRRALQESVDQIAHSS